MYDCANNLAVKKVTELYDQTEYKRHEDYNITCADGEDYMILKPQLMGSTILNSDVYRANWSWIRNYEGDMPIWKEDSNEDCGLSLDSERRYEITATTTDSAFNLYQFAVVSKEIMFPIGQSSIIQ